MRAYIGATPGQDAGVVLFGAPFDGTVSFRPGSRFGPVALREASDGIETYSPYLDLDLEEDCAIADCGDLELPFGDLKGSLDRIGAAAREIVEAGKVPFMLGGEHLVTLPALTEVARRHPDLAVVHLDAHADMRPDYMGNPLSHATVLRRVAELVGFESLRQIGIRSGTREEFALMREHGTQALGTSREHLAAALDVFAERPLYVTCDLDVFDPAYLPGTGTPEPGGIDFNIFATFVKLLAGRNIVGCDVVELAPTIDSSGCSAVLAAKVTRELLLCIPAGRRQGG